MGIKKNKYKVYFSFFNSSNFGFIVVNALTEKIIFCFLIPKMWKILKHFNLISEECDDDIFSQREMIFERCQFLEIQIDGTVRNDTIV